MIEVESGNEPGVIQMVWIKGKRSEMASNYTLIKILKFA